MHPIDGRALREVVPRSAHGAWSPAPGRPSPVDLVTGQNEDRLPWLVPVRHWRMAASPFTFYRGAAVVMANDLAGTPTTGIHGQICGDAHLSNFGTFGAPDRSIVFDLNDFDETLAGPWEWDVKRLVASFAIAARNNRLDDAHQRSLAATATSAYRTAMRGLAAMSHLDVWYLRVDEDDLRALVGKADRRAARKSLDKVRSRDSRHALGKLAELVDGQYRIVSQPPLVVPLRELPVTTDPAATEAALRAAFDAYVASVPDHIAVLLRRHRFVDLALKVVGVGSVGTRCWVVLLEDRDSGDPLFLQVKQATRSVLEEHLPASPYPTAGRRVVEGQRLMQAAPDIFLGHIESPVTGHHYYWRQFRDMKGSVEVEDLDPDGLDRYARVCGATLARSHARSADARAIGAYLGKGDVFDEAMSEFAMAYADQNEADFAEFEAAIADGRIEADPDGGSGTSASG